MCETTLRKFGKSSVFTVKIVGVFKTDRWQKRELTTSTSEFNGVKLTLTFTTSTVHTTWTESGDKKDLHKIRLTAF